MFSYDCDQNGRNCKYAGYADGIGEAAFPSNEPVVYVNWQSFVDSGIDNSQRDAYEDAVRAAVARWRQAPSALTPIYGGVDNTLDRYTVGDNEVVVFLVSDPALREETMGSGIGHAFHRWTDGPWIADNGDVLPCDIRCQNGPTSPMQGLPNCRDACGEPRGSFILLNGSYSWTPYPTRERSTLYDFGASVMHELGHAFGLCHEMGEPYEVASMNPAPDGRRHHEGISWGIQRYGPYYSDIRELQEYYGEYSPAMYTKRSDNDGASWPHVNTNLSAAGIHTKMDPSLTREAGSSEVLLAYTASDYSLDDEGSFPPPCVARGEYTWGAITYEEPLCFPGLTSVRGMSIDRDGDRIMMAWVDRYNYVRVARSADGGTSWLWAYTPAGEDAPVTLGTPSIRVLPSDNGEDRWVLAWAHFDSSDLFATGQIMVSATTNFGASFSPPTNLSQAMFGINHHTEGGVSAVAFNSTYAGAPLEDLVYIAFAEASDSHRWDFYAQPYGMRTIITGYRPDQPTGFQYGATMAPPGWRTYYRPQLRVNQSHLVAATGNSEFNGIDSTYTQTGRAQVATVPADVFPLAWQDTYTHFTSATNRLVSAPALAGVRDYNRLFMSYQPYQ